MYITTDGLGFMLSIGDLTWVPFVYSLQARYLVFNQLELGYFWTAVIIGCNLLGYYIFRAANGEKNDFRNGKNPKSMHLLFSLDFIGIHVDFADLQSMETKRGTRLLTSGWWGTCRHPNYLCVASSMILHLLTLTAGATS